MSKKNLNKRKEQILLQQILIQWTLAYPDLKYLAAWIIRPLTHSLLENLNRGDFSFGMYRSYSTIIIASHIQSFQLSGHSPVPYGPDKRGSTLHQILL